MTADPRVSPVAGAAEQRLDVQDGVRSGSRSRGVAAGVACDGCPPLPGLLARYEEQAADAWVCPICFNAKRLDNSGLLASAELAGTAQS